MYRAMLTFLALAGVTNSRAHAAEFPLIKLEQSSKWQVNYTPDQCQLYRYFGEGDHRILLRIAMGISPDIQDFMLIGKPFPASKKAIPLSVSLDNMTDPVKITGFFYALDGSLGNTLQWFDSNMLTLKKKGIPQTLTIASDKIMNYSFELGNVDKALSALEICQDTLWTAWGIDAKAFRELAVRPTPLGNARTWSTPNDYPIEALQKGITGTVTFLLNLDETGKPKDCSVKVSSGSKLLDDVTCRTMLARARFSPARNQASEATPSIYLGRVRWLVPTS